MAHRPRFRIGDFVKDQVTGLAGYVEAIILRPHDTVQYRVRPGVSATEHEWPESQVERCEPPAPSERAVVWQDRRPEQPIGPNPRRALI